MPPLKAYGIDIVGSMTGIGAVHRVSAVGRVRSCGSLRRRSSLPCWASGPASRRSSSPGGSLGAVPGPASSSGRGANQSWSPYYRVDETNPAASRDRRQRHPAPGDVADRRHLDPFYEQVYRWFPERTFERVLIVGAGSRHRCGRRADTAPPTSMRSRSIPRIAGDRGREPPQPSVRRPARDRIIDDGRAFLRRGSSAVRPRRLRPARLADPREYVRQPAPGVVPVHGRGIRRDRSRCRTACSCCTTSTARTRCAEKIAGNGEARLRGAADRGLHASSAATWPRPAACRPGGRRPPGDTVDLIATEAAPAGATDDWPFLYLREPVGRARTTSSRSR